MAIMVVDDDSAIREVLLALLEDEGYEVLEAADGNEALDRLRAAPRQPCLILLDLMMPRLDGWGFRTAQQADPALADIPVIVLSARPDLDQQMVAFGQVSYLNKPIDMDAMLTLVAHYCQP